MYAHPYVTSMISSHVSIVFSKKKKKSKNSLTLDIRFFFFITTILLKRESFGEINMWHRKHWTVSLHSSTLPPRRDFTLLTLTWNAVLGTCPLSSLSSALNPSATLMAQGLEWSVRIHNNGLSDTSGMTSSSCSLSWELVGCGVSQGKGGVLTARTHALGVSGSQQILIVQELRVLPRLPQSVEAEVKIHFNHFLSCDRGSKTEDWYIRCY